MTSLISDFQQEVSLSFDSREAAEQYLINCYLSSSKDKYPTSGRTTQPSTILRWNAYAFLRSETDVASEIWWSQASPYGFWTGPLVENIFMYMGCATSPLGQGHDPG
ncbi:unnamed protein product [Nesidiocoris tenuis]|uniref:Uncharacterized protein n=1 Tax=Nesidiocoris tenuis TaxID=355587 RepID=A0A6H5GL51_9HEMI|nr:unnamed protein product [Nesidiocoris tenuis]